MGWRGGAAALLAAGFCRGASRALGWLGGAAALLAAGFCRGALCALGWQPLSPVARERLAGSCKCVLVFSHSSYADAALFALYLGAYPRREHAVRFLVNPGAFKAAGPLLRAAGALQAPALEVGSGQGTTAALCASLARLDKWLFLISPKGALVAKPWRRGYYHVARQSGAVLRVAGLDYVSKRVYVSPAVAPGSVTEPEAQLLLKGHLTNIVPLHPDGEVVAVRSHSSAERTVANYRRLLALAAVLGAALAAALAAPRS